MIIAMCAQLIRSPDDREISTTQNICVQMYNNCCALHRSSLTEFETGVAKPFDVF